MRILKFIIFLGLAETLLAQLPWEEDFARAFDLISSEKDLGEANCQNNSGELKMAIFPQFHYMQINYFLDYLEESCDAKELKKILKADALQKRNSGNASYKIMTDPFFMTFQSATEPCFLLCFDRMKEGVIIAELIPFELGLDWSRLRSQKTIQSFLIDLRKDEIHLIKKKITVD